ncbi:MAG: hypothetical protein ABJQ70_05840 [Roseobacter sp.]
MVELGETLGTILVIAAKGYALERGSVGIDTRSLRALVLLFSNAIADLSHVGFDAHGPEYIGKDGIGRLVGHGNIVFAEAQWSLFDRGFPAGMFAQFDFSKFWNYGP